jgi:hypothetical protein
MTRCVRLGLGVGFLLALLSRAPAQDAKGAKQDQPTQPAAREAQPPPAAEPAPADKAAR